MENILSFNEEIERLMKKKLSKCTCNPCSCTDKTKNRYFRQLKSILTRFNKEYLFHNLMND